MVVARCRYAFLIRLIYFLSFLLVITLFHTCLDRGFDNEFLPLLLEFHSVHEQLRKI